jgi:hypothetical protein
MLQVMNLKYFIKGPEYPAIEEVQGILKDYVFEVFEVFEKDTNKAENNIEKEKAERAIYQATLYSKKTEMSRNTIFFACIKMDKKWVIENFWVYYGDSCSDLHKELESRGYKTSTL